MKRPTPKEIETEIGNLTTMKPHVIRQSMFGDNHHHAIEAQIKVLTEALDEDAIFALGDAGEWKINVRENALQALQWMDGEIEDVPSEGWKSLVR